MKKYFILFPILSIIIVLPAVYIRWSDITKANQITNTIAQARYVDGMALSEILGKEKEKNRLIILYTGNTRSELEPCGYYRGNSGGIERRAAIIGNLRKSGFIPLILDAGEMFSGETPLHQMKCETYLKAIDMMGYNAVCISASEFGFGREFLEKQMGSSNVKFISGNILNQMNKSTYTEPYIIKDICGFRIAVLGASNITSNGGGITGVDPVAALREHVSKLANETDLIILLSNLNVPDTRKVAMEVNGIDIILSSKSGKPEKVGKTMIYYSDARGKTIGMLSLSLDRSKGVISNSHYDITMQDDVPADEKVAKLVSGFYQQVASEPNIMDIYESLPELGNQNIGDAYIGSSNCMDCHSKEYEQWSMTAHAASFHSIKKMERYRYPNCMGCHTTGFGHETGYSINKPREELESVGCEVCHGPSERHSYEPAKGNIKRKVPREACFQCHTDEYSPGFMDVVDLIMPQIEHDQKPVSIKEMLEDRITSSTIKPTVDLFVMSYCPFGVMAENTLIPIINELNGKVDLNLCFIAEEEKEKQTAKSIPQRFKSMHGENEVIEDIRQVVIGQYYKDKLFGYILERNKKLKGDWKDAARKVGIDPTMVQKIVESEKGASLFRDNIKIGQELNIHASPTLMVNSARLPNSVIYNKKTRGNICK